MITWTIEAALKTNVFDKVLVSTDDQQTAQIAKEQGADCPFLRLNKADDTAPISEATLHALEQAEEYYCEQYDVVIQLMANCPLRTSQTISSMVEEFINTDDDFMLSHTRYGWLNPWWASQVNKENKVIPIFKEELKQRSQDLPELICPTGAIWAAKTNALKEQGTFHGKGKTAYIINTIEAMDIDDTEDWALAEALFEVQKNKM